MQDTPHGHAPSPRFNLVTQHPPEPLLSPADVTAVCQAFALAADTSPSFLGRAQHLLEATCKLIGARSVSFGLVHDLRPGGTLRLEFLGMFGDWTIDGQRRAFERYLQQGLASDPVYPLAVQHILASGGRPAAVSRPQLMDDATWYASEHVRTLRRPAGIDDAIYAAAPVPNQPGSIRAMTFVRAADAGNFDPHHRAIVRTVVGSLDWLFATRERELEAARLTDGLNASLWATLACLQQGDSVKQAAKRLGCTDHTISTYCKRLHRHFGVRSRGELLALCHRLHIVATLSDTRWARHYQAGMEVPTTPKP